MFTKRGQIHFDNNAVTVYLTLLLIEHENILQIPPTLNRYSVNSINTLIFYILVLMLNCIAYSSITILLSICLLLIRELRSYKTKE